MKSDRLIELLRNEVRPDPADDRVVESSLREAVRVFRKSATDSGGVTSDHGWRSFHLRALSAVAIAAVAAVLVFAVWFRPSPISSGPNAESLSQLFSEIELLFPSQVNALVMSGEEIDIQLTDESESQAKPADQRVQLTLGRGGETVTALTYSGQEIELNLDGAIVPVTPLIQADGSVFMVTEDSVIFSSPRARFAGFDVTLARLLPEKSLAGGES